MKLRINTHSSRQGAFSALSLDLNMFLWLKLTITKGLSHDLFLSLKEEIGYSQYFLFLMSQFNIICVNKMNNNNNNVNIVTLELPTFCHGVIFTPCRNSPNKEQLVHLLK